MISAFVSGFLTYEDKSFLDSAESAARFIKDTLFIDGKLIRNYKEGPSDIRGIYVYQTNLSIC